MVVCCSYGVGVVFVIVNVIMFTIVIIIVCRCYLFLVALDDYILWLLLPSRLISRMIMIVKNTLSGLRVQGSESR